MPDLYLLTPAGPELLAREVKFRITYRCATEGCPNSIADTRRRRCPEHVTDEDVLLQLREHAVFLASNFFSWRSGKVAPWGHA